jgi:hypothetical protein
MTKPDLYTKTVLTIIAAALLWVGFTLNTKPVHAAGATPVVITGITLPNVGGVLPVGITAVGWENYPSGGGNWRQGPLAVSVANPKLAVAITESSLAQPMPVTVANSKPVAVSISDSSDVKPK